MHVNYKRVKASMSKCICAKYVLTLQCSHFLHSLFPSSLNEEDDVISYHDLVVVLHSRESSLNLGLPEWSRAVLVDLSHQSVHAHRLSVCSAEDLQQGGFELLQPAKHTTRFRACGT